MSRRFFGARAFSLIELLVTLAVVLMILVAVFEMTNATVKAWKAASADPFAEAEEAFETVANHAAGATLESYQDYANSAGAFRSDPAASFTPDHLARRSDLSFACGPSAGTTGWLYGSSRVTASDSLFFVSPQGYTQSETHEGLERLLNALGYFVEFSDESNAPSFMLPTVHRWRWRLKEVVQPSESLGIYTAATSMPWVQALVGAGAPISILAENMIALVVLPDSMPNAETAFPANYLYDSRDPSNPLTRHQLPPRLRLAMVAIDEASAVILAGQNGSQPPALIPPGVLTDATKMDADLATIDASLTSRRIRHRILQREIMLPAADWSPALSQ